MLEIHPAADKSHYGYIGDRYGVDFDLLRVVEAYDGGKVIGFGAYIYRGGQIVILDADSQGDKYLYDGIIRTMLFLASVDGIDSGELAMEDLSLARELHFVQNGSNLILSVNEFMNSCKNCMKSR